MNIIKKKFFGIAFFYMHQSIPFELYIKKKLFLSFFDIFRSRDIAVSHIFFSKKYLYLTFVVVNFGPYATYRWKALKE